MQNLNGEWQQFVKRLLSRKSLANPKLAQEIVQRLGYKDFYTPNTTILDAYSGTAVLSAALNNAINPKTHILMEPFPSFSALNAHLENPPKVYSVKEDPFRWLTFNHLIEQGKFQPTTQPRTQIHNELLFTANLLHGQGEQLVTQYLNCITNQSWIEKYGRVRLLLWMRSKTAEKILAGPGEHYRHRVACQRESCCDARVVLHTLPTKLPAKYPELALRPLIPHFDKKDFKGTGTDISLVELTPHEKQVEHIDEFEYVIKMLLILKSRPLEQALNSLGPGAIEDLSPHLQDILHLKPTELTSDQLKRVTEVFWRWPFKPDILMDFYEEKGMGIGSEEQTRL